MAGTTVHVFDYDSAQGAKLRQSETLEAGQAGIYDLGKGQTVIRLLVGLKEERVRFDGEYMVWQRFTILSGRLMHAAVKMQYR